MAASDRSTTDVGAARGSATGPVDDTTRDAVQGLEGVDGATRQPARDSYLGDEAHPAEPGDLVEFVAAESAEVAVDDGVPGRGWNGRVGLLLRQLIKFGLVGGVGFIVDFGLYNLLIFTVLSPETVPAGALFAKIAATLVAITTNWIGNRLWTFRRHRRTDRGREAAEFFGVSLAGLVVGALPLVITHYGLGWTSPIVDNLANLVGLALGSVFRFALYRWWVFAPARHGART